jgi:uncharacterized protein (DUF58 family)
VKQSSFSHMRLRRTFWGVLSVLAASIWGTIRTQDEIFPKITYLCLLLLVTSLILGLLSVRGFRVKRVSREFRKEYGQVFEERFEIHNALSFVRPWIEVRDGSNLPGGSGARVLSWLGKKDTRNYSAYTLLLQRGDYVLGPTILHSGDLFGLFEFQNLIPHQKHLLVLPYITELDSFPYPPGLLPGGKAQRFRSLDVTPHASGVREYVPGDALKRIHWPSTAKKNKLIVKEFEQNPRASVWILLDAHKKVHFELPYELQYPKVDQFWLWRHRQDVALPPASFEYAVSISASIGRYFIRKGKEVGLVCAEKKLHILAAEHGERQLGKLLELLAFLKPEGGMPLQGLVASQSPHISRGSVVVLITPLCDDGLLNCVDQILRRDLRPIVVLLDGQSFGAELSVDPRVISGLGKRNVPTVIVKNGDTLKMSLEKGYAMNSMREWKPVFDPKTRGIGPNSV